MEEISLPKGFRRWLKAAPEKVGEVFFSAASMIALALQGIDFELVDVEFDGGRPSAQELSFQRRPGNQTTQFASVIFDRRFRLRFQISFGEKCNVAPHEWVRAGSLVWQRKSDLVDYKWWGPRWWQLNKIEVFRRRAFEVAQLVPEIDRFLADGYKGKHVLERRAFHRQLQNGLS